MNTTFVSASATSSARPAAASPRLDLYSPIHKALRALMFDTLQRIGRMDLLGDTDDVHRTLEQTRLLLTHLRSHVQHENDFLHAAIEARRPGGAQLTADAHVEHLDTLAALHDEVAALQVAAAHERTPLAQRLYRHVGLFVAENLEHMHLEETANNAALWALYSDDELAALHDRLVAHLEPSILMSAIGWMAVAMRPQELAGMLLDMQQKAPPEALRAVLDEVRMHLDDSRWAKLARALNLPPVPGLVTA